MTSCRDRRHAFANAFDLSDRSALLAPQSPLRAAVTALGASGDRTGRATPPNPAEPADEPAHRRAAPLRLGAVARPPRQSVAAPVREVGAGGMRIIALIAEPVRCKPSVRCSRQVTAVGLFCLQGLPPRVKLH
jgi:hypothetical protein